MTEATFNKLALLEEELLKSSGEMVEELSKMDPELQKLFAPKVEAMIDKTKELIANNICNNKR
jgi:hypothetical protein